MQVDLLEIKILVVIPASFLNELVKTVKHIVWL